MNKKHLRELTLILGGARSGKSKFAENLVLSANATPVYIASAESHDHEMSERIAAHQAARSAAGWTTIEEPLAVAQVLSQRAADEVVLFDCVTLWLSNLLMAGRDLEVERQAFLQALNACPARVVVVSNEVGLGIVPDNALAREFRDQQGILNQKIAERAGLVVNVMAGLPLVLKGALP